MTSRKRRDLCVTLLFGMLLLASRCWGQATALSAEVVLYNGKILTTNTEDPANFAIAEGGAMYDGKFVYVGSSQPALAGPNTRRIDLGGRNNRLPAADCGSASRALLAIT